MKISFNIPEYANKKKAYTWLASWFGSGFLSPAPGTWGSLVAIPFGLIIYYLGGAYALFTAIFLITAVGLWASHHFDRDAGGHDSKMIVIDEVAGQWIALIPAALNPLLILIAFISFRFFDILKPWPICFVDKKIRGAAGVMFDDILAGLAAATCVFFIGNMV